MTRSDVFRGSVCGVKFTTSVKSFIDDRVREGRHVFNPGKREIRTKERDGRIFVNYSWQTDETATTMPYRMVIAPKLVLAVDFSTIVRHRGRPQSALIARRSCARRFIWGRSSLGITLTLRVLINSMRKNEYRTRAQDGHTAGTLCPWILRHLRAKLLSIRKIIRRIIPNGDCVNFYNNDYYGKYIAI